MQDKSENYSEFSEKTERLAAHLRKNLNDLPPLIGISPAMFYAYRTGKNRISPKAWRKLESAEAAHGLSQSTPALPRVEQLTRRIREEFYLPVDADFLGLSPADRAEVLRAMADSIQEMERRSVAYAARATKEGHGPPARKKVEQAVDAFIAETEADVSRRGAESGVRPRGKSAQGDG